MKKDTPSCIRYCRNCFHPMEAEDQFCNKCGQKYTDGKITFGQLIREMVDEVFNLESKLFKTIGALFIPGQLTWEFFKGRHKKYAHPFRVFILLGVLFLAVLSAYIRNEEMIDMNGEENLLSGNEEKWHNEQFQRALDTLSGKLIDEYPDQALKTPLDSLQKEISHRFPMSNDTLNLEELEWIIGDSTLSIPHEDIFELSRDSLLVKHEIHGFFQQLVVAQIVRLYKKGDGFSSFILGKIIWMIFLTVPMIAAIFKLLYIRRKYLYVEHLVFCLHVHAFLFLILTPVCFRLYLSPTNDTDIFEVGIVILMAIYLFLAMKRFYGQGWIKTGVKLFISNLFYFIFLTLSIVLVALLSFFLY